MSLERGGISAHIQAHAPLVTFVADRVFPRRLPQDAALPAIVYRRVGPTDRGLTQSGADGLADARFQFDVWSADPDEADAIASELVAAFHGYRGQMGDTVVGVSRVANDIDEDEPTTGLFRRIVDVLIQHQEAA
jgi:hypothetical protein